MLRLTPPLSRLLSSLDQRVPVGSQYILPGAFVHALCIPATDLRRASRHPGPPCTLSRTPHGTATMAGARFTRRRDGLFGRSPLHTSPPVLIQGSQDVHEYRATPQDIHRHIQVHHVRLGDEAGLLRDTAYHSQPHL
ncbi:hypothetical protein BC834DRAFT_904540 [Gloeopeniophorella convolvens]|nr:hypothetical protein BC834DRAFT_904540 [Gloeopeniophorella convolvens]